MKIKAVIINEDSSGCLLIERPTGFYTKENGYQRFIENKVYIFDKAPKEVTALNGLSIYEDPAVCLMLGITSIATFVTHNRIEFINRERFKQALIDYNRMYGMNLVG